MNANKATIEQLIQDFRNIANRKNFQLPYHLHDGFRKISEAFGGPSEAMDWLENYRRGRFEE